MEDDDRRRQDLATQITGPLARRYSTATVLLHHAIAERLGLGPTDHKCLDLLLDRGPATGSQLAAITGLTTGAITGVVARLERAGFVSREPDPVDKRKQIITPDPARIRQAHEVFASLRPTPDSLLEGFDTAQLEVIAEFLARGAEFNLQRAANSRAQLVTDGRLVHDRTRPTAHTDTSAKDTS
jgi:DNA-binding MarR family transcriptional regulator